MTELVIVAPGWATTVQDAGRPGFGALGVPPSGALDEPMRQLLNRLVGNTADAAVLETLGDLRVTVSHPTTVATSAELAPISVLPGDEVVVQPAAGTTWGYLTARGGLAVTPVLGSRSTDSRSGLGPPLVKAGQRIPLGADPSTPIVVDQVPRPAPTDPSVGVFVGPRADWFQPLALDQLVSSDWTVSTEVSRAGARLDGPTLRRRVTTELPSEGVLLGAVQVPPDGRPVVMLADHPTTGGYPVLAIVDRASLPAVAQSRPGSRLRFHLLR